MTAREAIDKIHPVIDRYRWTAVAAHDRLVVLRNSKGQVCCNIGITEQGATAVNPVYIGQKTLCGSLAQRELRDALKVTP